MDPTHGLREATKSFRVLASRTAGRSGTHGFTLVELLVVIAIIGVLIALLLPAVQSAREAARRMQCSNQIKQLSLALQTYHDQHRRLPASGIVEENATRGYSSFQPRSGKMFSWIVLILPQMEQQPLHDQFDFGVSVLDQPRDPQAQHFPSIHCPSDSIRSGYLSTANLTDSRRFAKGNYAAFCSPYHIDLQAWSPGALIAGRQQRLDDIEDGTSNTWAVSEVRTREELADERGAWALPWTGATLLAFDAHDIKYGTEAPARGDLGQYEFNPESAGLTQLPNGDQLNGDTLYVCPNPAAAEFDGMRCVGGAGYLSAAPRSQHPGGVFVGFLDGHIQFVPNDIDERVMAYSISVNDGRTVSSELQ